MYSKYNYRAPSASTLNNIQFLNNYDVSYVSRGASRKFESLKRLTIYQVNRPFLCNFLRNIPKFFKSWQWVQTPLDLHLVVMFEVVLYVESGIQIKELLGQLLSLTVYSQTVLHAHSIQRLHMLQVMQKIQQSSHCFNVSAQK